MGVDKYNVIETYQDEIEIAKMIRNICHLQDENIQGVMVAVEMDKQLYLFYKASYHSNADYLEAFKTYLKLS